MFLPEPDSLIISHCPDTVGTDTDSGQLQSFFRRSHFQPMRTCKHIFGEGCQELMNSQPKGATRSNIKDTHRVQFFL